MRPFFIYICFMDPIVIAIQEYFTGFFDELKFYYANGRGLPNLAFDGKRNGNVFSWFVPHNMYEGEMLFHWLESIKGDCITAEQTILLEKK